MGVGFVLGTKSEFLATLGLKYGWIFIEGDQPHDIYHLEQGREVLTNAVNKTLVTSDEVRKIERAMIKEGLTLNMVAILEQARKFTAPEGFVPAWYFEICTDKSCNDPQPHGHFMNDGGRMAGGYIAMLADGFRLCDEMVRRDPDSALAAAVAFRQMIKANLIADDF